MVNLEDRKLLRSNQLLRSIPRCGSMVIEVCPMIVFLICSFIMTSLPLQVVAQDPLSREDALKADLAEALQMLRDSKFEMLVYDFMPYEFVKDMQQQSIRQYGRSAFERSSYQILPEPMKNQLISQLDAAKSGQTTWNRDKSLAWIQFTTKPIELNPARKPGHVPESVSTTDSVDGLGAEVDEVLSKAIDLLESKRFDEFAKGLLPLQQLATLQSKEAMARWTHRLKQHPSMVDAMIRDLRDVQAGMMRDTSGQSSPKSRIDVGNIQLEKVSGSWRLVGMDSSQRAEYQKLVNSEIAASIIPAQKGTMVLSFTEGRWRLMAMPTRIPSVQTAPSRR